MWHSFIQGLRGLVVFTFEIRVAPLLSNAASWSPEIRVIVFYVSIPFLSVVLPLCQELVGNAIKCLEIHILRRLQAEGKNFSYHECHFYCSKNFSKVFEKLLFTAKFFMYGLHGIRVLSNFTEWHRSTEQKFTHVHFHGDFKQGKPLLTIFIP